jgi:hypothetical protein
MLDAANSNEACAKSTCCNPANRQPVREPPGSAECGTNHVGLVMTLKALTLGPFGSRLLCKVRPVPVSNPGPISLPQNVWQHVRVGPRRSMRVRVGPRDVGRGPRQCRASARTGSIFDQFVNRSVCWCSFCQRASICTRRTAEYYKSMNSHHLLRISTH